MEACKSNVPRIQICLSKMRRRLKIKSGDQFGNLTVIKELEKAVLPSGQYNRVFLCKCSCGSKKRVRLLHLTRGRIKSCGCLSKKMNGKCHSPIGNVYRAMRYRCSPNYFQSQYYYDKGIKVYDKWLNDFSLFEKWAYKNGYKEGLQIDRIDNSKGYYPGNCRFVTHTKNQNNKSTTIMINYKGKKTPFMPLLRSLGLEKHAGAIRSRLKRGYSHKEAIEKPIRKLNK